MNIIKYLSQGTLLIAGLLCLRVAYFLYENQEGQLQNRLEGWWIYVDDYRDTSLSKHSAFMRRVARLTTIILDRVFGKRIFSLRAAWPASFFAYSSILIIGALVFFSDSWMLGVILLVFSIPFVALGFLPALFSNERWLKWGCLGVVLLYAFGVFLVSFGGATLWQEKPMELLKLYISVTLGLLLINVSFVVLVHLFRWSIRKLAAFDSFLTIIATVIILLLLSFVLVKGPLWLSESNFVDKAANLFSHSDAVVISDTISAPELIENTFAVMAMGNFAATFPLLIFVFLVILIPIHQIIWELIDKPLYAAQRFRIITNRKLLASVGIFLITTAGIPVFSKLIKTIADVLMGKS